MSIRIIVFKEKHDNYYYAARNDTELWLAALEVVEERLEAGWYNPGPAPQPPEEVDEDIIERMPEVARQAVESQREQYRASVMRHNDATLLYETAKQAVEERDGEMAMDVIVQRAFYEHEGYDIVYAKVVLGSEK